MISPKGLKISEIEVFKMSEATIDTEIQQAF